MRFGDPGLRARRLVTAMAVAVGAAVLAPGAAAAFEPIEGVWAHADDTSVRVLFHQTSPGTFQSVAISGSTDCKTNGRGFAAKIGTQGVTLTGSGFDYSGTSNLVDSTTCEPTGATVQSLAHVFSTTPLTMNVCNGSTNGPPVVDANFQPASSSTHCQPYVFSSAPEPETTFEDITSLPAQPRCTTAARTRGRRIHLRFHAPANEPLLSVLVKLGARKVFSYKYPARVPRGAVLRLPPAGGTLTITIKTVTGKTFKKHRHYAPCLPRHHHHHHHHHHH